MTDFLQELQSKVNIKVYEKRHGEGVIYNLMNEIRLNESPERTISILNCASIEDGDFILVLDSHSKQDVIILDEFNKMSKANLKDALPYLKKCNNRIIVVSYIQC